MIHRTFNAEQINAVLNHESVYPWVHGAIVGPLDASPIVQNHSNFCLWGEHGGMIFSYLQPGLYEFHTQVLPGGRGKWAVKMAHECFHWIFTHTDAVELLTRCPKGNLMAQAAARVMRLTFEFSRPNNWVQDHKPAPSDVYSYKIQDWMRDAPGLVREGEKFHTALEGEYSKMGFLHASHSKDDNHDRYVGATMEMVKGGQPYKAVVFYNRWAKMSGYQEISILKAEPVIMDITEAILMLKNDELKVVSCRSG